LCEQQISDIFGTPPIAFSTPLAVKSPDRRNRNDFTNLFCSEVDKIEAFDIQISNYDEYNNM
jgi:hypothetical protein